MNFVFVCPNKTAGYYDARVLYVVLKNEWGDMKPDYGWWRRRVKGWSLFVAANRQKSNFYLSINKHPMRWQMSAVTGARVYFKYSGQRTLYRVECILSRPIPPWNVRSIFNQLPLFAINFIAEKFPSRSTSNHFLFCPYIFFIHFISWSRTQKVIIFKKKHPDRSNHNVLVWN